MLSWSPRRDPNSLTGRRQHWSGAGATRPPATINNMIKDLFYTSTTGGSSEKYKTDMKRAPPRLLNYQQLKLIYFDFRRRSFDQLYIIKLSWPRFYLAHTDTELDDVGLMWVIRLCYFHLMSIARRLFLNRHLCTISPLRSLKERSPRVWEWK